MYNSFLSHIVYLESHDPSSPVVIFGLLPHEQKVTEVFHWMVWEIVHFTVVCLVTWPLSGSEAALTT